MTDYVIECYEKHAKRPYRIMRLSLPARERPTYADSKQCFNYELKDVQRVKIKYANNSKVVGISYVDVNGNKRIKWKN